MHFFYLHYVVVFLISLVSLQHVDYVAYLLCSQDRRVYLRQWISNRSISGRTAALGPRRNYQVNAEMWAFMTSSLTTWGMSTKLSEYFLNWEAFIPLLFWCFCGLQCTVSGVEWGGETESLWEGRWSMLASVYVDVQCFEHIKLYNKMWIGWK